MTRLGITCAVVGLMRAWAAAAAFEAFGIEGGSSAPVVLGTSSVRVPGRACRSRHDRFWHIG